MFENSKAYFIASFVFIRSFVEHLPETCSSTGCDTAASGKLCTSLLLNPSVVGSILAKGFGWKKSGTRNSFVSRDFSPAGASKLVGSWTIYSWRLDYGAWMSNGGPLVEFLSRSSRMIFLRVSVDFSASQSNSCPRSCLGWLLSGPTCGSWKGTASESIPEIILDI